MDGNIIIEERKRKNHFPWQYNTRQLLSYPTPLIIPMSPTSKSVLLDTTSYTKIHTGNIHTVRKWSEKL